MPTLFTSLFFTFLISLNVGVAVFFVDWRNPVSWISLAVLLVVNIGVAYQCAELLTAMLVREKDLDKLDDLTVYPPVALLYTTFNDLIPDIAHRLKTQAYPNLDIYVLDDSTQETYKRQIDNLGLTTIRRSDREGFKAGNLNNWLRLYGKDYKYIVVADSDSLFEPDFVETLVRYAEHPSNVKVVMFQSNIWNWNGANRFAGLLADLVPLRFYAIYKLANHLDTIMSWGHNNLIRIDVLQEVGGFDADYVGEDFATALNLIERGYLCKMVDVISYDAEVESIQAYRRRTVRYAKQTLQIARNGTRQVSFLANLHVFMSTYFFLVWIVYLVGKTVAVWGYRSSFDDLRTAFKLIFSMDVLHSNILPIFVLAGFYIFQFLFARLPIAWRLGIRTRDYFWHMLVYMAMHYYLMFPLIFEQLKTLLGERVSFTVTRPRQATTPSSFLQVLSEMRYTVLFILFLAAGLLRNPMALLFNSLWILPLMFSPLVVYWISRSNQPEPSDVAAFLPSGSHPFSEIN